MCRSLPRSQNKTQRLTRAARLAPHPHSGMCALGWTPRVRARPFGHISERATHRLEAENALVLVRRSCRGGARALPRHSELLTAGAHASRESGAWLEPSHESSQSRSTKVAYCRSEETTPVVERPRRGLRADFFFSRAHWTSTSERGWGASLNPTRSISLDAPGRCGSDGAESERQRCRGRAARPRVRWFASRAASASLLATTVNELLDTKGSRFWWVFFFF